MMPDGTDEARGERLTRGLRLYVISDDDLALELTHEDVLEVAIASGATAVELAVPIARTADLVRRGQPLRAMARERGVLFFVLNDVDAAAGLEADGVFLNRGISPCGTHASCWAGGRTSGFRSVPLTAPVARRLRGPTSCGWVR